MKVGIYTDIEMSFEYFWNNYSGLFSYLLIQTIWNE